MVFCSLRIGCAAMADRCMIPVILFCKVVIKIYSRLYIETGNRWLINFLRFLCPYLSDR